MKRYGLAIAALLLSVGCVRADTVYDFTVTGGVEMSGTILLGNPWDANLPDCQGTHGFGPVLSFAGEINGNAIDYLNPATQDVCLSGPRGRDTGFGTFLLYESTAILFEAGGDEWSLTRTDLNHPDGWEYLLWNFTDNQYFNPLTFTSSDPVAPVPEPGSLLLLAAGVGLIFLGRRAIPAFQLDSK